MVTIKYYYSPLKYSKNISRYKKRFYTIRMFSPSNTHREPKNLSPSSQSRPIHIRYVLQM